jgi:tetratricopeptide (TPR) repeat protein
MLQMSTGDISTTISATEKAIEIYGGQVSAYINAGVALGRQKKFVRAAAYFQKAMLLQDHSKVFGYAGMNLIEWLHRIQDPGMKALIQYSGKVYMDMALERGWEAPTLLHARASIAFEENDYFRAERYYTYALQETRRMKAQPNVPHQVRIFLFSCFFKV